jgi:FdhD protein
MRLSSWTDAQAAPAGVAALPIVRLREGRVAEEDDDLAVEEPLEIVIDDATYAVTMRLPGDDTALAAGFCLSEGVIARAEDIASIDACPTDPGRIHLRTRKDATRTRPERRGFLSKSSCGLCGKEKLADIHADIRPVAGLSRLDADAVLARKADFEARKLVFPRTGSTHSAALYSAGGECLGFAEDVGRHNALDKAVGAALLAGTLETAHLALVSSRLSFEMVQKAAAAGIEILAGVSAATTLAAQFAERWNVTLVGFLRRGRMNVYAHPERIRFSGTPSS